MIDETELRQTVADVFVYVKTLYAMLSHVMNDLAAVREALIVADPDFQDRNQKKLLSIQASTYQVGQTQLAGLDEIIRRVSDGEAF